MHRLIGGTAAVAIIGIGVGVTLFAFLYLEAFAGDIAADNSRSVEIVYDAASGEPEAAPPQAMTDSMELGIWLGLLSINLGLAAAVSAGLVAAVVGWRKQACEPALLERPWAMGRSLFFGVLLAAMIQIMNLRIDTFGALKLQPPIEPRELVPRVFDAAKGVTWVVLGIGVLGFWALFWLREVAAADWSGSMDDRRQRIEVLRGIVTPLLAGLSLMIVGAILPRAPWSISSRSRSVTQSRLSIALR